MFAVVSIGAMWCEASPAGVDCGCLPPCIVVKYSEEHFGLDPVTGVESSIGIREYEACCHAEGVVISQNGIRSFLSPTSAQTIVLAERTLIRQQVGYTPHFEYVLAVLLADPSAEPLWPPGELPAGQGLSLSYSEPTTGFLHEMDLASREPFRVQEYRLWIHSRPVPTSPGEPVVLPDRRLGRVRVEAWDAHGWPARIERTIERWGPGGSEGLIGRSVYTVRRRESLERGDNCPLRTRPTLTPGWTVSDPQRALIYEIGEQRLFLGGVEIKVDEPILVGPDELSLEKVIGDA